MELLLVSRVDTFLLGRLELKRYSGTVAVGAAVGKSWVFSPCPAVSLKCSPTAQPLLTKFPHLWDGGSHAPPAGHEPGLIPDRPSVLEKLWVTVSL